MKKQELVSQSEYAKHIGLTQQAVSKMVRAGRIPTQHGRIDVADADRLLEAENANGDKGSLADAIRRKETALASLRELELQKKSGKVCEVESVLDFVMRDAMNVKAGLLAFPSKLVQRISCEEQVRRLIFAEATAAVREMCWNLVAIGHCVDLQMCSKCEAKLRAAAAKVKLPRELFPKEAR